MTTDSTTAASPPVSPPAKRMKQSEDSPANGTTTIDAVAESAAVTEAPVLAGSAAVVDADTTMADSAPAEAAAEQPAPAAVAEVALPVALAPVAPVPALLIKKLSDKARVPTRGSAFAAGYDIYASKETVIPARGKALVDTDISMAVPAGTYGRIAPRSGLAAKHFIDTGAGVIDADYRGQVKVLLFNHGEADFKVAEGDRVAQLVLERIVNPDVLEVAELEESVRGAGGFGSTGVAVGGAPL